MGRLAGSKNVARMREYGQQIFKSLAKDMGMDTGFAQ